MGVKVMIFLVASTLREATDFIYINRLNPHEVKRAAKPQDLLGYRHCTMIMLGEWWANSDNQEIKATAHQLGFKVYGELR